MSVSTTAGRSCGADRSGAKPIKRREYLVVAAVLLLIGYVQISAALRGDAIGQDYQIHFANMRMAAQKTVVYLFGSFPRTNPPLSYVIAGCIYNAVGEKAWPYVLGVSNAGQNLLALAAFYVLELWLVPSGTVRILLLFSVGSLAVFQITSVVFAADAYCQLPVILAVLATSAGLLKKISYTTMFGALTGAVMILVSLKYTALSLIPAGVLALWIVGRGRHLRAKPLFITMLSFSILTASLGFYWIYQNPRNVGMHFDQGLNKENPTPNQMNLRSLVFFRSGDRKLLDGPLYWDLAMANPRAPESLNHANYFSYPGLLCFSMFSDVMGIFQPKQIGSQFGNRSPAKARLTRFACRLGGGLFVGAALLLILSVPISVWRGWNSADPREAAVLIMALFSFAWHAAIVVLLPSVPMATAFGYWLPRLILPSLMLYAFIAFRRLSLTPVWRNVAVRRTVTLLVGGQALLQLAILA